MRTSFLLPALLVVAPLPAAPPVQPYTLPNGLRLLLLENHERSLVRLELRVAWDPAEESAGKAGIGGMLGDYLQGAAVGSLDRAAFQRFLDEQALRFRFAMKPRSFAWSILCDSQSQDAAFEALALAATKVRFDPTLVEALRQHLLQEAGARTVRQRALERFRRATGQDRQPSEESRIDPVDVETLLHRVLRPERSLLVVQGDLTLAQATKLALLHLGAWGPAPQAPLAAAAAGSPASRTWVARDAGMPIAFQAGAPWTDATPLSDFDQRVFQAAARALLGVGVAPSLEKVAFEFHPGGAWSLQAQARKGQGFSQGLAAFQALVDRLRSLRLGARDVAEARSVWAREALLRALHPGQEASDLADRVMAYGETDPASTGVAELQARWDRLLAAPGIRYYLTGEIPQDLSLLRASGLSPVESD